MHLKWESIVLLLMLSYTATAQYNRPGANRLLYKVYFDTSDFHLDERDNQILDEVAKKIKAKPGILYEVSGHTDTSGTEAYNQALSLKRAQQVSEFLISRGVSKVNLLIVGKGESEPMIHRGRYSPKFSRRVEFKQILRVRGRIFNAQTGHAMKGKVLLAIPNKPMKSREIITGSDGRYEFITIYKPAYALYAFADGFITEQDSIDASLDKPGASNVEINFKLSPAIIKERISFNEIYFYPTSFRIMPESEPSLQELFKLLQENPEIFIEIRGHVSQPNREKIPAKVIEDGMHLSFARAKSVYGKLVKMGISPTRIKYRGMGSEEMPFPSPEDEEQERQNRRVEVLILKMR